MAMTATATATPAEIVGEERPRAPRPVARTAGLDARDRAVLDALRRRAADARLAPRIEPFRFCALIEATPEREAGAYLDAVLRVLPAALDRRVAVHHPGAAALTFDEAWLIGTLRAFRDGDEASAAFALASRVARPMRRPLGFLLRSLAERLDSPTLESF